MGYLIHYVIRVFEKTENTIIELNTHIISVFF